MNQLMKCAKLPQEFTDKDNACLRDLLVADPETERRRIEATKGGLLDDSFRWVLGNAEFQKWRSDPRSQFLWIKGDPGKGKTMLVIGIINELLQQIQSQPSQSIPYFLCQGTDHRLNNTTSILRSLIYMLIQQQPHLITHLRESYVTDPKLFDSGNTFYSLSVIFDKMVQSSTSATITLLIDGLDECELGLPELLQFITSMKSTSTVQVKWVVSSRNRDDIEQALEFHDRTNKLNLELNANHISDAVAVYINYRVSRLTALQKKGFLLEQVKEQLRQKSDGTFLWVSLVIQEMQKCQHLSEIIELFEKAPRGLTPLYNHIFLQIQRLERLKRESCMSVLSVVTLAYRPLHLHELRLLVSVPKQHHGFADLENIIAICGSFLTIRDDHVYLIHQSAKDYLRNSEGSTANFPAKHFAMHHRIYQESLQNLSTRLRRNIYELEDPAISVSKIIKPASDRDPLIDLRYSCMYWLDHFLEATSASSSENVSKAYKMASDFFKKHLLHWLESLSLIGGVHHGILALKKLVHQQQVRGFLIMPRKANLTQK
jgi:hypothetical protein